MTVSVVPLLIDALVARCQDALPSTVAVYDGMGVSDDPSDYVMIGVEDPFRDTESASESKQEWFEAGVGAKRSETGTILCAALAWTGDTNVKVARERVYDTANAIAAMLRAGEPDNPRDFSLGLDGLLWTSYGTNSRLHQGQTDDGCFALVMFEIYFEAQI